MRLIVQLVIGCVIGIAIAAVILCGVIEIAEWIVRHT